MRSSFSPVELSFGIVAPDLFISGIERPSSEFKKRAPSLHQEGGPAREILKGKRDVTNLGTPSGIAWTPDGKQLIFGKMVSRDKTELWKISIEDGSLQKIGILSLPVHDIVVHPNGTRLAFSAIEYLAEVWVMENFLPKEEKKLK